MSTRYLCENRRRAELIRADAALGVNGIDYLEVLDSEAPPASPQQRTLLVRLLQPLPPLQNPGDPGSSGLAAANVRIEGGVRITPIGVEWIGSAAQTADLLSANLITPAEALFFSSQIEPDHLLLVRTNSSGDFDRYTLRLVQSPTDLNPFDGFDLILNSIPFSFKVECPSDFDCESPDDCPPPPQLPGPSDYLARDFNSLRRLILDRLAITNPQWQERHLPDLNIALVELLAYVGDYLSYWQDAVATEAYLGTARRRVSLRRHARLLGYDMHDGCNARTWLTFGVERELTLAPDPNSPLQIVSGMPGVGITVPSTDLDKLLAVHQPQIFELCTKLQARPAHNRIDLHTWGDEECCLPAGATGATLVDSSDAAAKLQLAVGDVLIFEEVISPATLLPEDADPARRHAVRLTQVEPLTDRVLGVAVVEIGWDAADALPFPLCISKRDDVDLITAMTVVRGNVALADHGRTQPVELLQRPPSHRQWRPQLRRQNITMVAPLDRQQPQATALWAGPQAIDTNLAAAALLQHNPKQALPAIALAGDGQRWTPRRDLLESDRFAPHFVAEMEEDGSVQLRFGDGIFGLLPSDGAFSAADLSVAEPGAVYRVGSGPEGNVGADSLRHVVFDDSGISLVRNPLPAVGGVPPESLQSVRLYAPQAFRRQERAVTPTDYAAVSARLAGVQRAAATRRWTGSWHTISITVDRQNGGSVDASFAQQLREHVEQFRLAGHDVAVDQPRFIALDIRMTVCVSNDSFRENVEQALLNRFSSGVRANGERGFFHADNFTFGQPLYLSDVIATAMAVPGVQWVDFLSPARDHRFQRWAQVANNEIALGQISFGRLEIARLDNDPSLPENGRIQFYMEGGR